MWYMWHGIVFYEITMDFKKSVQLVIFQTCNKLYGKKSSFKHSGFERFWTKAFLFLSGMNYKYEVGAMQYTQSPQQKIEEAHKWNDHI